MRNIEKEYVKIKNNFITIDKDMKVQNKTFVVTGGAKGLGRAMTLLLLKKGANVVIVDRHAEAQDEVIKLAGKDGERITKYQLDITDKEGVEKFAQEIVKQLGAIDGLINNAGIIQPFVPINELEYKDIDRVMQTDFFGHLYMIKAFLPHLLTRPEAHITNIDSMGGFFPVPGQTIYGAAKAALKLLSEGLSLELADTNVDVSLIFPGGMNTNIAANSGVEMGKMSEDSNVTMFLLEPEEAAELVIDAIEKEKYLVPIGKDSKLMNFLYKIAPESAPRFFGKLMQKFLQLGK